MKQLERRSWEQKKRDYRVRIGERAESVVALLASRVPQAQVDGFAIDHQVHVKVVKDGGHILGGEPVLGVGDEHGRLACAKSSKSDDILITHGLRFFFFCKASFSMSKS